MRESDIEKKLVHSVELCGGLALKFISPGNAGVPDRLILLNGKACFAEVKAPGEKPRPLQRYWKRRLNKLGFKVYVVDSMEALELMLGEIHPA